MKYTGDDHTFTICAYGKSEYIEECIKSVIHQQLKTRVIICTSTPSVYLSEIAKKHSLPLFVNKEKIFKSNIAEDWNYAIRCAGTPLVTIAHQDDLYKPGFTYETIKCLNKADHPIIAFTDYAELRNGEEISNIRNLNIKRFMLFPLRNKNIQKSVFVRRRILSFGSPICCPSVTYVVNSLPVNLFVPGYKVNLDWQAWERFSRLKGEFVFVNSRQMVHRIHMESETSRNIEDNNRTKEDLEMFCMFWPKRVAEIIESLYKNSERQNIL